MIGGAGLAALAIGVGLLANYYDELPGLRALQNTYGVCKGNTAQTTFSDCQDSGGEWASQYRIESNKQEFGWTFVGIGSALGAVSGFFFADVFE